LGLWKFLGPNRGLLPIVAALFDPVPEDQL